MTSTYWVQHNGNTMPTVNSDNTLAFNGGANEYIADGYLLDPAQDFEITVEFDNNATSSGTHDFAMMLIGEPMGANPPLMILRQQGYSAWGANNSFFFGLYDGSSSYTSSGAGPAQLASGAMRIKKTGSLYEFFSSSDKVAFVKMGEINAAGQPFASVDPLKVVIKTGSRTTEVSGYSNSQQPALTDGLVAKYALDTDANDSAGSNNLSLIGGTVSYGAQDGHTAAAGFSSGELRSDATIDLTGEFTVSFWAKEGTPHTYYSNNYSSFFRYGTAVGSYFDLYLLNGKIRTMHNNATSGWGDNRGSVAVPAGWNHYAMTIDPSSGSKIVYLNGVAQTLSGAAFTGTFASSQKISLGNTSNDSAFRLNGGAMDDTRIWNRVLSASEVAGLFASGAEIQTLTLTDGLILQHNMDDATADVGSIGFSNTANGTIAFATGDGRSYVDMDDNLYGNLQLDSALDLGAGGWTLSTWFSGLRHAQNHDSIGRLWDDWNGNMAAGSWQTFLSTNAAGEIHNDSGNNAQSTGYNLVSNVTDSDWHMITAVHDGSSAIDYYLDGVLVGSTSNWGGHSTLTSINSGQNNAWFLSNVDGNGYKRAFADKIDDFRAWNRALSSSEIATLHTETTVLEDRLVATWNFDDDTGGDSVGSANGTVTDLTYATADGITYAEADGSGNKMDLGTPAALDLGTSDFTISGWANMDVIPTGASGAILYNKGMTSLTSSKFDGFQISFYQGNARFFVGGQGSYTTISEPMSTGQWYHFMGIREGTTMKFYINGVLADTQDTGTVKDVTSSLNGTIFSNYNGTWYTNAFDGKLADIRIWSRALSDGEATSVHATGPETGALSLEDSLVAKYPLYSDGVPSVGDVTFTASNVTYGAGESFSTFANQNSGYYVDSPYLDLADEYTLSFWFKDLKSRAAAPSGFLMAAAYNKETGGVGGYANWDHDTSYDVVIYTNDMLGAYGHANASAGASTLNSTGYQMTQALYNGTGWHHMACAFSGGQMTYYINGVQVGVPVSTTGMDKLQTIGSYTDMNYAAFEYMDDFRVYNKAISAADAVVLHAEGADATAPPAIDLSSNLTSMYALTADVTDSEGNFNATNNGVTFANDASLGRDVAVFAGGDYFDIPAGLETGITNSYTLSLWIKPDATRMSTNVQQGLFTDHVGGSTYPSIQCHLGGANENGKVVIWHRHGNGSSHQEHWSTGSITPDVWTQLVFVYSGSTMEIYINGVLDSSGAMTMTPWNNPRAMRVGQNSTFGHLSFVGSMSDMRFWTDRALTAADNSELHTAGTPPSLNVSVSATNGNVTITTSANAAALTAGTTHWAYSITPLGAVGQPHNGTLVPVGTTSDVFTPSAGYHTIYYGGVDASGNVLFLGTTTVDTTPVAYFKWKWYTTDWSGLNGGRMTLTDSLGTETLSPAVSYDTNGVWGESAVFTLPEGSYTWSINQHSIRASDWGHLKLVEVDSGESELRDVVYVWAKQTRMHLDGSVWPNQIFAGDFSAPEVLPILHGLNMRRFLPSRAIDSSATNAYVHRQAGKTMLSLTPDASNSPNVHVDLGTEKMSSVTEVSDGIMAIALETSVKFVKIEAGSSSASVISTVSDNLNSGIRLVSKDRNFNDPGEKLVLFNENGEAFEVTTSTDGLTQGSVTQVPIDIPADSGYGADSHIIDSEVAGGFFVVVVRKDDSSSHPPKLVIYQEGVMESLALNNLPIANIWEINYVFLPSEGAMGWIISDGTTVASTTNLLSWV